MYRKFVALGLCVVDHVFLLEDAERGAPRTRYRERLVSPGGMASNAAAQAARLGCPAHLLTVVGADREGRELLRSLRQLGVRTSRVLTSPRCPTSVALVLVERSSGQRRFAVRDRRTLEARAPRLDLSVIGNDTLLLVDGHFPRDALAAVRHAREAGASVIGDFNRPSPAVRKLLPFVDFPVVPREFSEAWAAGSPGETVRALRKRYGGTPVVTLGERGAVAWLGGRVRRIPAYPVRAVDTTGAGDAFHGAFAAGLYHGRSIEDALHLASRAAAITCTGLGALGKLMSESQMKRFSPRSQRGGKRAA